MQQKSYLATTMVSGIFSWSAWILVITKLNPNEQTQLALLLFFTSLFFASVSTLTIMGVYLRKMMVKTELLANHMNIALRQAVLLSLCITGCLLLLLLGVLTWWDGLLLVFIIILIEIYFSSNE